MDRKKKKGSVVDTLSLDARKAPYLLSPTPQMLPLFLYLTSSTDYIAKNTSKAPYLLSLHRSQTCSSI